MEQRGTLEFSETADSHDLSGGWRNLWLAVKTYGTISGKIHTSGSIFYGDKVWATKGKAEEAARKWFRESPDDSAAEYLGAFQTPHS